MGMDSNFKLLLVGALIYDKKETTKAGKYLGLLYYHLSQSFD